MLEKLSTIIGETRFVYAAEGEDAFLEALGGLQFQTQMELLAKLEALASDTELSESLEFQAIWWEVQPETQPKTFVVAACKDSLVLSLIGGQLVVLGVFKLTDRYTLDRADRAKAQGLARLSEKGLKEISLQEEL